LKPFYRFRSGKSNRAVFLADRLVEDDPGGRGEVEGADVLGDGDPVDVFSPSPQQFGRKPPRFTPENQIGAVGDGGFPIGMFPFGRQEEQDALGRDCL